LVSEIGHPATEIRHPAAPREPGRLVNSQKTLQFQRRSRMPRIGSAMARILLGRGEREASSMSAVARRVSCNTRCQPRLGDGRVETTLLDLVQAVAQRTDDEREIVAIVLHLLRTGRVRLIGNFRGRRLDAA
jgi:hypothetical protein